MKTILLVIVAVLLPYTVIFCDEPVTHYKLESHIYRLFSEPVEVDWDDANVDVDMQREAKGVAYRIGDALLHINGDSFQWDGNTSPSGSDALLISRPTMLLLPDQTANIVINSGKTMDYLEKESGKGKQPIYRLKHITLPSDFELNARVLAGKGEGYVRLISTISVVPSPKREYVEGTSLNVGKPIITQIESTSDMEFPVDIWFCTIVPLSEADYVLVLFKVEERKSK